MAFAIILTVLEILKQKRTVLKRSDELKQNSSIGRPWEGIRDEFLGKNK